MLFVPCPELTVPPFTVQLYEIALLTSGILYIVLEPAHTTIFPRGCVAVTGGLVVTGIQNKVLGPQGKLARTHTFPPVTLFQVTFIEFVLAPEVAMTPGGNVQVYEVAPGKAGVL